MAWAVIPSVGHALIAGTNPRSEPPSGDVSAHSGNDRYREDRRDDSLLLPGPRFCPESALGHDAHAQPTDRAAELIKRAGIGALRGTVPAALHDHREPTDALVLNHT